MPHVAARNPQANTDCELIWGIELNDAEIQSIYSVGIKNLQVECKAVKDLTIPLSGQTVSPTLTFIPQRVWTGLSAQDRRAIAEENIHKPVLILDGTESKQALDINDIISQNFLAALTLPLSRLELEETIQKAHEIKLVYNDIFGMTNEIMLERELLCRKNEQLDFLNKILTKASKSLNPGTIINQAGKDLKILLEVESVMGIFWNNDAPAFMSADIFLSPGLPDQVQNEWIGYLLDQGERHARYAIKTYQITHLDHDPELFNNADIPDPAAMIRLPLVWGDKTFGILFITSNEAAFLGRDKVQVLHSVANHLALALRNALLYRNVQNQADHDGLTRIFNRQNFDNKIVEELKRHQRYQNELSLLMLDLDYFKRINDEYGHLAGDMVLRQVGDMLRDTLRECDFPARYGGEEFVVILPQTQEEQAWILAERIRKKIASHRFHFQNKYFQITASIGISSMKPTLLKPAEYLVQLADQALYKAKTCGRNMVCRSADPQEQVEEVCKAAAK